MIAHLSVLQGLHIFFAPAEVNRGVVPSTALRARLWQWLKPVQLSHLSYLGSMLKRCSVCVNILAAVAQHLSTNIFVQDSVTEAATIGIWAMQLQAHCHWEVASSCVSEWRSQLQEQALAGECLHRWQQGGSRQLQEQPVTCEEDLRCLASQCNASKSWACTQLHCCAAIIAPLIQEVVCQQQGSRPHLEVRCPVRQSWKVQQAPGGEVAAVQLRNG